MTWTAAPRASSFTTLVLPVFLTFGNWASSSCRVWGKVFCKTENCIVQCCGKRREDVDHRRLRFWLFPWDPQRSISPLVERDRKTRSFPITSERCAFVIFFVREVTVFFRFYRMLESKYSRNQPCLWQIDQLWIGMNSGAGPFRWELHFQASLFSPFHHLKIPQMIGTRKRKAKRRLDNNNSKKEIENHEFSLLAPEFSFLDVERN